MRDRPVDVVPPGGPRPRSRSGRRVHGTVVALGFTSLLTDVSSEMVNAVLPVYLTMQLGFTPLAFAFFDGAYQGMTGLLRIAGGVFADRRGRYKEVAGLGYGLSAACKLGLLLSPAGAATTGILLADRTGKGIRTAPRDALISLSSEPAHRAEAFAVHRALDTAGALLGPILAFVLLGLAPGAYDSIFVASFCIALLGLAVLFLFVRNRAPKARPDGPRPSWAAAAGLLRIRRFRSLVAAGTLLGLVTVSDAFLYLVLQDRVDMPSRPFPLLFVGTAVAYLVFALPFGRLADRAGRWRVFLGGHVLLVAAYAALATSRPGWLSIIAVLGLLGAYYAATDGVLMAMTSTALPPELCSSGLAVLTTATAAARFAASVLFGLGWMWLGPDRAMTVALVALAVAVPIALRVLSAGRRPEVTA